MYKIQIKIFMLLFIFVIGGCATTYKYGKTFKVENVKQIKIGETTREDVISLFGAPLKKGISNGNDVFIYSRENIIFETDDNVKREGNTLIIEFDSEGKVKNYYLNVPGKETSIMSYVFYKKHINEKKETERESLEMMNN